jgi:hypothetical protein
MYGNEVANLLFCPDLERTLGLEERMRPQSGKHGPIDLKPSVNKWEFKKASTISPPRRPAGGGLLRRACLGLEDRPRRAGTKARRGGVILSVEEAYRAAQPTRKKATTSTATASTSTTTTASAAAITVTTRSKIGSSHPAAAAARTVQPHGACTARTRGQPDATATLRRCCRHDGSGS